MELNKKITEKGFSDAAKLLNCEVACIKAVYEVESNGSGFLPNGEVKILFEPHIFWIELVRKGIKPIKSDICYPNWTRGKYGSVNAQHERLQRAVAIDRDCALKSASWGLFQVMGFNFRACGCKTLQEFINKNIESEDSQLLLFCNFVMNSNLADELRDKKWAAFALGYNGKGYKENSYDTKLAAAYKKYK